MRLCPSNFECSNALEGLVQQLKESLVGVAQQLPFSFSLRASMVEIGSWVNQTMHMGLSALIVEDDAFTRAMLTNALRANGVDVVAAVAEATEAVRQGDNLDIKVALLDLHLGKGPTGIDAAYALRRKNPLLGIVFLTSFDDPRLLESNLPELPDRSHYLTKSSVTDVESLIRVLQDASDGRTSINTPLKNNILNKFSNVQLDTIRLVAQGLSNAEIAKKRFVTERSVEISISRAAKALGIGADAARNQRVHIAKVVFRAIGRSPFDDE